MYEGMGLVQAAAEILIGTSNAVEIIKTSNGCIFPTINITAATKADFRLAF
jgi:hypothetical protein